MFLYTVDISEGTLNNRRLLEIDKHYSLELCFSIENIAATWSYIFHWSSTENEIFTPLTKSISVNPREHSRVPYLLEVDL